jgi:hypothetical protein
MLISLNAFSSILLLEAVGTHLLNNHLVNRDTIPTDPNAYTTNIVDKSVEFMNFNLW